MKTNKSKNACGERGSNTRPSDLQSDALPTELSPLNEQYMLFIDGFPANLINFTFSSLKWYEACVSAAMNELHVLGWNLLKTILRYSQVYAPYALYGCSLW
ncbi:hypothetical protein MTR_2g041480 [Medicago truncatula]|uniref:Uncharacterized protein n=1 Tax=Medicago truncatula TaxID=3880 RepID=A0A072V6V1_MEDTR|nr:hypothetical protein MTR_2g041480 [Medicago truncatula]